MNPLPRSGLSVADILYDELSCYLSQQRWGDASRHLDLICRLNESHGGAWELRGLLEAQAARPNLAINYFNRAKHLIALEPGSTHIMAIQLIKTGRTKDGLDLLYSLGTSADQQASMACFVSQDLLTHGYPDLALNVIHEALLRNRKFAPLWHELTAIQSVQGVGPEVRLKSALHTIDLAPQIGEYRVTAATIMIQLDKALLAYETVLSVVEDGVVHVDCPCCLWRLICIFDCFEDRDRMTTCYRELARTSNPNHI